MKKNLISRALLVIVIALAAYLGASAAPSDYFLKITGGNGISKTVKITTGDKFEYKFDDVAVGSCTVTIVDENGNPVSITGTVTSTTSVGAGAGKVQMAEFSKVAAPGGQPSGRRQYQPITVSKYSDKASALLIQIAISEPGLSVTVSGSIASYNVKAMTK